MKARSTFAFMAAISLCCSAGANIVQVALAGEPEPAVIVPGTKITTENWQPYARYMSEGMRTLFEGRIYWRMPKDLILEVGPTIAIPPPKRYLADTQQYSSAVRLVRSSTGSYVPQGYRAGIPFPNPLDGDRTLAGPRIFWNCYYRYQPRVQAALNYSYTLDQAGNMTQTSETLNVLSQLAFLSDDGFPNTIPDAGPYYSANYSEEIAPEQTKYTTVLDRVPSNPTLLDEMYEYVPTLRRSLRLSQAARCAPVFGSDYVLDDENDGPPGLPQLFKIEYLGEKKILALVHAAPAAFDDPGTPAHLDDRYYYRGSADSVPFPKPAFGKWELRDCYVVSLERLPQFADGYCYSKRVMYIDKENYFGAAQLDLYGPAGGLSKVQVIMSYPSRVSPEGDTAELAAGPNTSFLINFADKHVSIQAAAKSCVNKDCEKRGYLDVNRYAGSEGLLKIMQ